MADVSLTNTGKGLGIVLVNRNEPLDPTPIAQAGAALGLSITSSEPGVLRVDGTIEVAISLMPSPHPEAMDMIRSPTSAKPETLQQMTGHYVIVAFGLPENDQLAADWYLSRIVAAVIRGTPAIAAMLGEGRFFYEADFFARAVENDPSQLATQIAIDITAAGEPDGRMSLLTHGLNRYGFAEALVVAPDLGGAIVYTMSLARDTVGGVVRLSADAPISWIDGQMITPVCAPSPFEGRPDVMRLDGAAPPKKKGLFGRRRS